jgi:hypothetical protein
MNRWQDRTVAKGKKISLPGVNPTHILEQTHKSPQRNMLLLFSGPHGKHLKGKEEVEQFSAQVTACKLRHT